MEVVYLCEVPEGYFLESDMGKAFSSIAFHKTEYPEQAGEIACYCGVILPASIVVNSPCFDMFLLIPESLGDGGPWWDSECSVSELEPYEHSPDVENLVSDIKDLVADGVPIECLYVYYGYEISVESGEEPYLGLLEEPLKVFEEVENAMLGS